MERSYFDRLMFERRMTSTAMAKLCGINRQAVDNWKTRGVPAERFDIVAAALGVSVRDLEREYGRSTLMDKILALAPSDRARVTKLVNEIADKKPPRGVAGAT